MQDTITCIADVQEKYGVSETSILNYVVSDGNHLIATRYVFPESANAASLYYAEGSSYRRQQEEPNGSSSSIAQDDSAAGQEEVPASKASALHDLSYCLEYGVSGSKVAFVASEPITDSSIDWVSSPADPADSPWTPFKFKFHTIFTLFLPLLFLLLSLSSGGSAQEHSLDYGEGEGIWAHHHPKIRPTRRTLYL